MRMSVMLAVALIGSAAVGRAQTTGGVNAPPPNAFLVHKPLRGGPHELSPIPPKTQAASPAAAGAPAAASGQGGANAAK